MRQGITHTEAVRLAIEQKGHATAQDLAVYIQEIFGLTIKPAIVTVLLGSLQERETLNRSGQDVYRKIERYKAENPEEVKRMAAAARRSEAARRRKAKADLPAPSQEEQLEPRPGKAEADIAGM